MEQFLPFSCNLALVRPEANNTLGNRGSAEPWVATSWGLPSRVPRRIPGLPLTSPVTR